jgi:PQQ-like domain
VSRTGTIRVGNIDGSGARTLFANESYPVGVAIDPAGGKIYWGSYDTFKIRVGNLNGTGATDLFTGENYPTQLAIDPTAGKIYWTNEFNGNVRAGNLNGTGATSLYAGEGDVGGVAIDPAAGKIYWTNWNLGTVRVGSLDGTAPAQSVHTGQTDPWMVALLRAPLGTRLPQVSGGSAVGQTLTCSPASWGAYLLGGFLYRAPRSLAYQWTVGGTPIAGATTTARERPATIRARSSPPTPPARRRRRAHRRPYRWHRRCWAGKSTDNRSAARCSCSQAVGWCP